MPITARLRLIALLALPLAGLGACATPAPPPPAATAEPTVVSTAREAVGVVTRVDQARRTLTIRIPNEDLVTVTAGPEIRNFGQIRRNDRVRVRYEEAIAVRVANRGAAPTAGTATGAARTAQGDRPGAAAVRVTRARVTINAVDAANNRVTFTGQNRVRRTVAVRDPELQAFVRGLRPGSRVDVTFAQAVALSVEPAER